MKSEQPNCFRRIHERKGLQHFQLDLASIMPLRWLLEYTMARSSHPELRFGLHDFFLSRLPMLSWLGLGHSLFVP
ncbi:hypothetical protein BAE30_10165 [Acidithiobacillus caldus]|uniref:Uncharacterized protein n=1 Tax=Acidithiobacillus caldus TaxID=33059 RepID=A0A1E7YUC5_9PROT|nr:hypothetical protein BAE30_10165 [Acidithiobacillus caldus]